MLNHKGAEPIKTDRLSLRRFRIEDSQQVFDNFMNDEEVSRHLIRGAHNDVSQTREYLQTKIIDKYISDGYYRWAICFENEVIGSIGTASLNEERFSIEIGYSLGRKWWGMGIMTEALKAVIEYLFSCGFVRLYATHHLPNPASGRIMEKCGMEFEGILRRAGINNKGKLVDVKQYSIINPLCS